MALLALAAIVLYPLLWLFLSTFKPSSEFGSNPGLIPENPTVDNYTKVVEGIAGTPLWRFFANSFFIAIMAVIGTVLSSALAAYAFARIRFRGVGRAVRGDDRHAAAAVPRDHHPAVHHVQ